MFEARTDISIESLKPSMKDLKDIDEAPVGEGVVVQVKADGESAWCHYSLPPPRCTCGARAPISAS